MRRAAGYLRRSVSRDPAREQSREAQESSVRRLAGEAELDLFVDWGLSGGKADRPGYQRLRAEIEADQVSTVFAYSLSRLGRSTVELLGFFELCEQHGTTVVTEADGSISAGTATGRMLLTIMAAVASFEREATAERSAAAREIRRLRGDHQGPAPFGFKVQGGHLIANEDENVRVVIDAFRKTTSLTGATKWLNDHSIRPRGAKGSDRWQRSTVAQILRREAPDLAPRIARRGRPAKTPLLLAGLLACPYDDSILSGHHDKRRRGFVSYECKRREDPGHPWPRSIAEAKVLPLVKAEADRLAIPYDRIEIEDKDQANRAILERQRAQVVDYGIANLIPADQLAARLAVIDDALKALGARRKAIVVPGAIDWTQTPERVNETLRAIWDRVKLGPDLMPREYLWSVPEWRA